MFYIKTFILLFNILLVGFLVHIFFLLLDKEKLETKTRFYE